MTDRTAFGQRGAALLLAMIILTLVSTIAASMVWQQWRAIQVEAAERARTQAAWILSGALDWARLILSEDARPTGNKPPVDHLGEPWAVPLAEARLSSFLAADKNNNAEDTGPDAFLSGTISDAQGKFNLSNLLRAGDPPPTEDIEAFRKLCELVSVPGSTADRIVQGLRASTSLAPDAPVPPRSVPQLAWLGVDAADLRRLEPFVALLGVPQQKINLNTAPAEVIAAVTGADLASAQRLVQSRQREPIDTMQNAATLLGLPPPDPVAKLDQRAQLQSSFFEVEGQVRLGDRVLRERSLLYREGRTVTVVRRDRVNLVSSGS